LKHFEKHHDFQKTAVCGLGKLRPDVHFIIIFANYFDSAHIVSHFKSPQQSPDLSLSPVQRPS
jgi:hypothetical protein